MLETGQTAPFPPDGAAIVIGASGAIGQAIVRRLSAGRQFAKVIGLSRHSPPALELTNETSIAACAAMIADAGHPFRLVFNAAGFLHGDGAMPEKSLGDLDAARLARAFAINTIGPALLMKHFLPLLPRDGKSVFATLSAKVGSIGDNHLGGWYGYRASKAALNQMVKTAAIELRRRRPEAICVALHPGTVASALSAPFVKSGLDVRPPDEAARQLCDVLARLGPVDNGGFFDYRGDALPW